MIIIIMIIIITFKYIHNTFKKIRQMKISLFCTFAIMLLYIGKTTISLIIIERKKYKL